MWAFRSHRDESTAVTVRMWTGIAYWVVLSLRQYYTSDSSDRAVVGESEPRAEARAESCEELESNLLVANLESKTQVFRDLFSLFILRTERTIYYKIHSFQNYYFESFETLLQWKTRISGKMYAILLLSMTVCLSAAAPFSSFDLKRATDTAVDKLIPDSTTKLLTIVKKNLKPNKDKDRDDSTVIVSEELVIASTGFPTFDAFDQNSDGFVEFEEFAATDGKDHKSHFQRADTNGKRNVVSLLSSKYAILLNQKRINYSGF